MRYPSKNPADLEPGAGTRLPDDRHLGLHAEDPAHAPDDSQSQRQVGWDRTTLQAAPAKSGSPIPGHQRADHLPKAPPHPYPGHSHQRPTAARITLRPAHDDTSARANGRALLPIGDDVAGHDGQARSQSSANGPGVLPRTPRSAIPARQPAAPNHPEHPRTPGSARPSAVARATGQAPRARLLIVNCRLALNTQRGRRPSVPVTDRCRLGVAESCAVGPAGRSQIIHSGRSGTDPAMRSIKRGTGSTPT